MVLKRFAKVRRSSCDDIKKEIALYLLEDFLILYTVRKLPFLKDKVQDFKITDTQTELRSLRTRMKQSLSIAL